MTTPANHPGKGQGTPPARSTAPARSNPHVPLLESGSTARAPQGAPSGSYPPSAPPPPPPDHRREERNRRLVCCCVALVTVVMSGLCGIAAWYLFFRDTL